MTRHWRFVKDKITIATVSECQMRVWYIYNSLSNHDHIKSFSLHIHIHCLLWDSI